PEERHLGPGLLLSEARPRKRSFPEKPRLDAEPVLRDLRAVAVGELPSADLERGTRIVAQGAGRPLGELRAAMGDDRLKQKRKFARVDLVPVRACQKVLQADRFEAGAFPQQREIITQFVPVSAQPGREI